MKIFKNEKVYKICLSLILMLALILGCINNESRAETQTTNTKKEIGVMYNTHIQNVGWEKDFSKKNEQISGTTGKSLRLEAIKIKLENASGISVKYQTHIQNIGWQEWKKDGEMAGTSGKSLRLEAIRLTLENSDDYTIMYRVHVQNIGWQEWKYDGEMAGTSGQSLRLEAIQIKIVPKKLKGKLSLDTPLNGSTYSSVSSINVQGWKMANVSNTTIKAYIDNTEINASSITYYNRTDITNTILDYGTATQNPKAGFKFSIDTSKMSSGTHTIKIVLYSGNTTVTTISSNFKIDNDLHVKYSAHVQNVGWQGWKQDSATAGTSGQSLRLEAIKIEGTNLPKGVSIKYQTHVQNVGWQGWKTNGELSGTSGKSLRLEGIRIKLEGTEEYSIMYRTHVQNLGWQEWCYDGEISGTFGQSLRVEAIQIKIVPKIKEVKTKINIETLASQTSNTNQLIKGWIMTNTKNTAMKILIDNKEIDIKSLKRTERQDIINSIKGYGNEDVYNKTPGFEIYIDFSKYSLGKHSITIQLLNGNKVIETSTKEFTIRKKIEYSKGIYGKTGLKEKGDSRGSNLTYYKYGSGPNVFFATFALHGYEDLWAKDGQELITIANDFYQQLINSNDYDLAEKWTIYIFPGVNLDGLKYGTTNNGPGRTTLYSVAPNHKGIDLNRCWQVGDTYTKYKDNRNYNGTEGFQAYEARYLRDFLLKNKSKDGQTILVDLHGWTQQVIGDSEICSYYSKQFPKNDKSSVGRYGIGYLINWARNSLGSTSKAARSALIELPNNGVNGHQSVVNNNFSKRYIQATLDMLENI